MSTTSQAASSVSTSRPTARRHPWQVLHACEFAREVLPLVEGQLAVGMRPLLLTPRGYGGAHLFLQSAKNEKARPISLLQTWNHVRDWRRLLNESSAESSSELIHAHSFSAGMAAVRASSAVVYEWDHAVEKIAAQAGNCAEDSWIARSFRVAEQFVLSRAAAIVVPNAKQHEAAMERGINAECIFRIPEPAASEWLESSPERRWLEKVTNSDSETVVFVVPLGPSTAGTETLLPFLRVLGIVRREHPQVRFAFLADARAERSLTEVINACDLQAHVSYIGWEAQGQALASADAVICDNGDALPRVALEAMARGRALLAADVEAHREITPEGRGCLWFHRGDVRELAQRVAFLAANQAFRRSLGAAGREHCVQTRSPEVIAGQYDPVYRLAASKRKGRNNSNPRAQLLPLHVGG